MEASSFWLISIEESYVSVSLINSANGRSTIVSIGPQKNWSLDQSELLAISIDESLSEAATSANISEESEPTQAAFVLPSFWIGSDGKITPKNLKLIETLCKDLTLKPIGFIADDEALVEESNQVDSFPASFILLHLAKNEFTLSLVYLGHIKERIRKNFSDNFKPEYIESALIELKSESTLPPQIIVFGQVSNDNFTSLKDFTWVGKKDVETFLHFPEVKLYNPQEIINIFVKTITSQINPQLIENQPEIQKIDQIEEAQIILDDPKPEIDLEEVDANELGFFKSPPPTLPVIESIDQITEAEPVTFTAPKINLNISKIKFSFGFLKKIRLPKIKFNRIGIILLAISPLLIIIPVYFSKAKITIFVTPYSFNKQLNITLDSTANSIDIDKFIIPVVKKVFNVTADVSTKTTGQKTIGEKAKGDVVIFNISDKTQSLPQGTILIDSTGKNFELTNAISITAGSLDLNQGVQTLGQTKASVAAIEIGSEYNINKDSKLKFKEFPESSLVAKVSDTFTGGTKQQINAVSDQDKKDLEQKINQSITDSVDKQINDQVNSLPGIFKETIQSKTNKIDFSREVGEEADQLTANADATVTVFVLDTNVKEQIINKFLSKEPDFSQAQLDSKNFNFSIKIGKINSDTAQGALNITGKSLPKIDIPQLKKTLTGKSATKAEVLIRKTIPRAYNFNIKTNFQFIKFINPLPFISQNITIDVQFESL